MSNYNEIVSSLTKINSNNSAVEESLSASVYDHRFNNFVSSTFNKISETNAQFKDAINALSETPKFTSDPEKLAILQNYVGEYTNHISLVSALARKAVSTIETLEKSQ